MYLNTVRVNKALATVIVMLLFTVVLSGCINEADNSPPRAIFQTEVSKVDVGDVVNFDATNSSDKDGSITAFHWDFGDGEETLGMTAVHVYEAFGVFNVTLTVTDDLGKKSIYVQTIVVNGLPRAVIGAQPEVQFIDDAIAFNADQSSDPDGNLASFLWDFGDGNGSTQPNPFHTYGAVGSYMVTLTVTDNRGTQDVDTRFVRVNYRNFAVNFTLSGANADNQRDFTAEGTTSYVNLTIDEENLHLVRFGLSWRDNVRPPGGAANDMFRLTVIPPDGFSIFANGTEENLTLTFPLASIPLNRTMEGRDTMSVLAEVQATLGSQLGRGEWLVQIEAIECGGFRDSDDTWIEDPGNVWDLAVHYEYYEAHVTQA
jgi:PKD repeat protein